MVSTSKWKGGTRRRAWRGLANIQDVGTHTIGLAARGLAGTGNGVTATTPWTAGRTSDAGVRIAEGCTPTQLLRPATDAKHGWTHG